MIDIRNASHSDATAVTLGNLKTASFSEKDERGHSPCHVHNMADSAMHRQWGGLEPGEANVNKHAGYAVDNIHPGKAPAESSAALGVQSAASLPLPVALPGASPATFSVAPPSTIKGVAEVRASAPAPRAEIDKPCGLNKLMEWHKTFNQRVRIITLGITVPTLLVSLALLAGVTAVMPLIGIIAVGIVIGVAAALYANGLSEHYASALSRRVSGKSRILQSAAGASVGLTAAALHGASFRGMYLASVAGSASGMLGSMSRRTESGMAGANALGAAVGTVDTLALRQASLAMHAGAVTGGLVGGWVLGNTRHSARVGEKAGYGAFQGAVWGGVLDNYTSAIVDVAWWGFLQVINRQFTLPASVRFLGWSLSRDATPGLGEWSGSLFLGLTGATLEAVDINTDGEITRIAEAADTARRTVSLSKFLRAVRNQIGSCFGLEQAMPLTTPATARLSGTYVRSGSHRQ